MTPRTDLTVELQRLEREALGSDPVAAAEAITRAAVLWRRLGYDRAEVVSDVRFVDVEIVLREPERGISPAATFAPPRLLRGRSFAKWAHDHPEGIALSGRAGRVLAPIALGADALWWPCPEVDAGLVMVRCEVLARGSGLLLAEVRPIAAR